MSIFAFQCPISVKFHVEDFLLHTHHTSYGTIQLHVQWATWCFHGSKWPECGVDHPALQSAATEHVQSYTSTPPLSLHLMSQTDLYLSPLGDHVTGTQMVTEC